MKYLLTIALLLSMTTITLGQDPSTDPVDGIEPDPTAISIQQMQTILEVMDRQRISIRSEIDIIELWLTTVHPSSQQEFNALIAISNNNAVAMELVDQLDASYLRAATHFYSFPVSILAEIQFYLEVETFNTKLEQLHGGTDSEGNITGGLIDLILNLMKLYEEE